MQTFVVLCAGFLVLEPHLKKKVVKLIKKIIKLIYIFYQYFAGGYQFLGGGETPLRSAGQAIVWQNKY